MSEGQEPQGSPAKYRLLASNVSRPSSPAPPDVAASALSFEHQLPVEKSHTDIVKFASQVDTTSQTVVKYMKDYIGQDSPREMLLSVINNVDLDHFLSLLSVADQEKHLYPHRPLIQPEYYWIFKNCDFVKWSSGKSPVLWLSGPTEYNMSQVSSNIIRQEMDAASGSQHLVLYFFCSTAVTMRLTVTVFVHTLLHQFISCLEPDRQRADRQRAIVTAFLRTLLDSAIYREPSYFKREDPSNMTLRKILDAPTGELWAALMAALDVEREQKLSIIIDGLDSVEQKPELIKGLYGLVIYLLERPLKSKTLLTGRPQADIKEILDGLLCIEYDKERKGCLDTLRFEYTHYDKISEEHEGSLQWLWVHEKYRAWSSTSSSNLLLVEGKPGSGKSTLTKYFKRNLSKREPHANHAIVASFFDRYREGEQQQTNHTHMLRSILFDVLNQNESFFFHFQPYYRDALQSATHFQWSYGSLKKILLSFRDHPVAERLFLIMDGVDESNNEDRLDLVQLLGEVCSRKNVCIMKIFLASRPINELNPGTHNIIKLQDVNRPAVSKFVGSFLCPDLDHPTEILRQVTEYIVGNAQGVFIWVHLVKKELIKYSKNGCSRKKIFAFLKSLPTELEGFYNLILDELMKGDEQDIKDGIRMFQLVLFAYRPLRLEELRHALAIPDDLDAEFSSADIGAFDDEMIHGIDKHVIHCGGNLLEIKGVHEDSIVQIMHQTVREFFRSGGPTETSKFRMGSDDAHIRISVTCLRYLMLCAANTKFPNGLPGSESWALEHFEAYAQYLNSRPLINYALSYLQEHLRKCSHRQKDILRLTSQFYDQLANNPISYLLQNCHWVDPEWKKPLATRQPLAANKHDNAKDFRNRLLHTATRMGLSRVVEALLIAGADVEACQNDQTPLIISAESGVEATARVLLDRGAHIEAKDNSKQRALHLAAGNGHYTMVRLLVNRGADKEAKDQFGQTALHVAAGNGHDTTVQLLVDQGADKEAKDQIGQTALHVAAGNGHDTTVQLLVDQGAGKEAKDQIAQTALHVAAGSDHDTTVQLLVEDPITSPALTVDKNHSWPVRFANEKMKLIMGVAIGSSMRTVRIAIVFIVLLRWCIGIETTLYSSGLQAILVLVVMLSNDSFKEVWASKSGLLCETARQLDDAVWGVKYMISRLEFDMTWALVPPPIGETIPIRTHWNCTCGSIVVNDFLQANDSPDTRQVLGRTEGNPDSSDPGSSLVSVSTLRRLLGWGSYNSETGSDSSTRAPSASQIMLVSNLSTGSQATSRHTMISNPSLAPSNSQSTSQTVHNLRSPQQTGQTSANSDKYILLCFNDGDLVSFVHFEVTATLRDQAFYEKVRETYYTHRGWWKQWFSLYVLSRVNFVKFELIDREFVGICNGSEVPKLDDNNYEFDPNPPDQLPPVLGFMHFFHYHKCARSDKRDLTAIPKKTKGRLAHPPTGFAYGWGIHFIEEPSWLRVGMWSGTAVILTLVSTVTFSKVMGDISGGFGVVAFFVAVAAFVSVIWACMFNG